MTGQVFGRLTVIEKSGIDERTRSNVWLCQCECGEVVEVKASNLTRGHKKSCGCLKSELARKMIENVRPSPDILAEINRKTNKYNLEGKYGIGWTSNGDIFYFDLEDFDKIKEYCWNKNKDGYIVSRNGIRMHNLIYPVDSELIDHINGKPEDNRKLNLREASSLENSRNTKVRKDNKLGVKGVTKRNNKYIARITVDKKLLHLGSFSTLEEAISKRKEAEIKYFGEYSTYLSRGEIDYLGVSNM